MTRRKLTTLIVAGVFAAALLGLALFKTNELAAPQEAAATTQDAEEHPADTTPTQVQEAPQSTEGVFMPPSTNATGSAPAPK